MKTINFTKNIESNKVLNSIYESLLQIHDTEGESISEIKHYADFFPNELDYNIYRYGNMLVCYNQIIEFYNNHGVRYANRNAMNSIIEHRYCKDIRKVVNYILENNK